MMKKQLIPQLRFPDFLDNWKVQQIKNIAKVIGGGTPSTTVANYWNGEINWFTPTEIKYNSVSQSKRKITSLGLNKSSATILPIGTILLTTRATIGEVAIAEEECTTNQGFQSLVVNSQNFNQFVFDLIKVNKHQLYKKANGSTFKEVSKKEIEKIKVLIPSLKEQQKIASFLTDVDLKITQLTEKKALLENYKKGIMQQIFSQEIRFKDDDGGAFPDWVEKKIQKLLDEKGILGILDGNHGELYPKSDEFTKEGIPYIAANNLVNGNVDFTKCKRIPFQRASKFKKGIAIDGDVLFAHNATVGPTALLNTELEYVILSTTVTYYRCDNQRLLNTYLLYCFNSDYFIKQYSRVMSQSTRNQVPITMQKKFLIKLPCLKEQTKIANFLSDIDTKIEVLTSSISKAKTFKKGLLQQMFV